MDDATLQKMVAEVAKRDLREDEATRQQAVEQFNTWLETNPDIRNYKRDDFTCLLFLRKGKFSIPVAQELFLRFMNFMNEFPHFMRNCDILDPKVNLFLRNGYIFVSPFLDDNGCHTTIIQYANFDPNKCHHTDYVRAQVVTKQSLMVNEVVQVLGVVVVVDMAGYSAAKAAHLPLTDLLPLMKAIQQCIPLRYKAFHIINLSTAVKWILDLVISQSSEKMKRRYVVHNSLEDLHKHVSPRVLPQEYGGTMPSKDMIDLWYEKMLLTRGTLSAWDSIDIVQPDGLKTSIAQLPGSFRKLEVD